MTAAMFGYVCNDALIKRAAEDLPLFEAIFLRGSALVVILTILVRSRGISVPLARFVEPAMALRIGMETIGTAIFLLALTKVPLAGLTAVMQLVPIAVTFAAARLLRESLSMHRLGAVVVGFVGVLFVIRPGSDDFTPWFLAGLITVGIVVVRELATRQISNSIPAPAIALGTGVAITTMGGVVSIFQGWQQPSAQSLALLAAAATFLSLGYLASVIAIRNGDIGFTAPFRYTVMIFAIVLQIVVFSDVPDAMTFIGSAIVSLAGIYMLLHERGSGRSNLSQAVSDTG